MTLMLDPEPTLAASAEEETQSLHAWSQADDADTVIAYHPGRSWRLPALFAVLAAAAVAVTVVLGWPQSAGKQQAAPTKRQVAAAAQLKPEDRYANLYRSRGGRILPGQEQVAAHEAQDICTQLAGETVPDMISGIVTRNPGFSRYSAAVLTNTAIDVYCPQYSPTK